MSELWGSPFALGSVCIAPGCQCEPGYTGRSDWVNAEGYLCQINNWAVKALWIAHLVEWLVVLALGLPKFNQLYRRVLKKHTIKTMPPVVWVVFTFFGLVLPCCCAVAFVRIFDDDARIALSLSMTIPWCIARFGIFSGNGIYQPALLKKVLAAENITPPFIRYHTWRERAIAGVFALNSLIFIPVYVTSGMDTVLARVCFAVYLATNGLFMLLLALSAKSIDDRMGQMLMKSYEETKSDAVLALREKLHGPQLSILRNSAFQAIFNFVWLMCPPLWVAHDYLAPVTWISVPLIAHVVLDSAYLKDNESSRLVSYKQQTMGAGDKGSKRMGLSSKTSEFDGT